MAYDDALRRALRAAWQCVPDRIEPLAGSMTSLTWLVVVDDEEYVAKLVPAQRRTQFEAGLAAAHHLLTRGIDAGAPVRTLGGGLVVDLEEGPLALLRSVPGRPLAGRDPVDQQWWGDLLGVVHRALEGFHHPGLQRWHWVRSQAAHLDLEPWLRPAVAGAVAAMTRLAVTDRLTYGVLHGDPSPDAFRIDAATGRTGLIDWGSAATGPLMFDVASAVMYAGGPDAARDLLDGYAAAGPVPRDEIDGSLPVLLRFRWAVQADCFARRIHEAGATGLGDPVENLAGLHRARDALAALAAGDPA